MSNVRPKKKQAKHAASAPECLAGKTTYGLLL